MKSTVTETKYFRILSKQDIQEIFLQTSTRKAINCCIPTERPSNALSKSWLYVPLSKRPPHQPPKWRWWGHKNSGGRAWKPWCMSLPSLFIGWYRQGDDKGSEKRASWDGGISRWRGGDSWWSDLCCLCSNDLLHIACRAWCGVKKKCFQLIRMSLVSVCLVLCSSCNIYELVYLFRPFLACLFLYLLPNYSTHTHKSFVHVLFCKLHRIRRH